MTEPKVSVIIPSYNHARFIERAVESVWSQSYRNLELIVVDDGSRDESSDVLRGLKSRSPIEMHLHFQENQGAHAAINRGMALASGEYINVLNSDDAFTSDRIELCLEASRRSSSDFVFTNVKFVDEGDADIGRDDDYCVDIIRKIDDIPDFATVGFSLLHSNVAVSTGNFFVSARLAKQVGPFKSYKYCHDWDYVLRSLWYCEPTFVRTTGYCYRLHGRNSFRELANVAAHETTKLMTDYFESVRIRPRNPIAPSVHNWGPYFWEFVAREGLWTYVH